MVHHHPNPIVPAVTTITATMIIKDSKTVLEEEEVYTRIAPMVIVIINAMNFIIHEIPNGSLVNTMFSNTMFTTPSTRQQSPDDDKPQTPQKKVKLNDNKVSNPSTAVTPTKPLNFNFLLSNSTFIVDDPTIDFAIQIRKIFSKFPSALPPATPVTIKRTNECVKHLNNFSLVTTFEDQTSAIRFLNLALSDGVTKGN
ncbi:hypothetical protein M422DRAFT_243195 [Sphaerobolus stellatus SS14]|nr:hypothetical protein M422DRAFT_243195 [Sphaerobolus stellatus SS14]